MNRLDYIRNHETMTICEVCDESYINLGIEVCPYCEEHLIYEDSQGNDDDNIDYVDEYELSKLV